MFIQRLEPIKEIIEQMKEGKIKPSELVERQKRIIGKKNYTLVCPVTATTAFRHMKPDSFFGPVPVYKQRIEMDGGQFEYAAATTGFTIPFSVTGNPVAVMPVGISKAGLPISVQVVGKKWRDHKLLDICERLMSICPPPSKII